MATSKITYHDKTNEQAVVDRTKQVTAEDLNEIKQVVNDHADSLDLESQTRENADANLLSNIKNEVDNRKEQDDYLQSQIEMIQNLRIDKFTYNEVTEIFENVENTYQDIANSARICVKDENNNVKYYCSSFDPRFKENGEPSNIYGYTSDTIVNINGSNYTVLAADFGNVFVEFEKTFFSHNYMNGKHTWNISKYPFLGSNVHPAFLRYDAVAGKVVEVDHANIGRYEGVLFDASQNRCVDGVYIDEDITADAATKVITFANPVQYLQMGDVLKETTAILGAAGTVFTVANVTRDTNNQTTAITVNETINDVATATAVSFRNDIDLTADKLMSVSGYKPLTYISQIDARALAGNNGSKYSQQTYADWFLIQLLAAVKYSTLNIQTALGAGKTTSTGNYKYVSVTGLSDASGMADFVDNTANLELAGGASIFGIENPYGNIWKWMDGMNINDWLVSLSVDNSQFDNAAAYEDTGIELPHSNGYWGKIINTEKGIFPASIDGDSANAIGDYYYQSSGNRVGLVGGSLSAGAFAGLSYLNVYRSASHRSWLIGARVRS